MAASSPSPTITVHNEILPSPSQSNSHKRSLPLDHDDQSISNSAAAAAPGASSRNTGPAATSNGSTPPTKKVLERNQACLSCRQRKRKCDGAKPTCGACERLERKCNYQTGSAPTVTKIHSSSSRHNHTHNHSTGSTRINMDRSPSDSSPPPTRIIVNGLGRSPPTPAATTNPSSVHSNQNTFTPINADHTTASPAVTHNGHTEAMTNGTARLSSAFEPRPSWSTPLEAPFPISDGSLFAWQFLQTSPFVGLESIDFNGLQEQHHGQVTPPMEGPEHGKQMANGQIDIPEHPVILELVNLFFEQIHPLLPCLYEKNVLANIRPGGSLTKPSALTFAILAISGQVHPGSHFQASSKQWYALAKAHFDEDVSAGRYSLQNVQAGIYICLYGYVNADYGELWVFIAKAYRMACVLGLAHIDSTHRGFSGFLAHPKSEQDVEERRRAIWGLYVLDRYVSLCCEWPMAISDRDFCVNFPVSDDVFQSGEIERMSHIVVEPFVHNLSDLISASSSNSAPQPTVERSAFHYLCKLSVLVGRIVAHRNSPVHPTDTTEYDELDTTLARFRLALPRKYRNVVGVVSRELAHVTQLNIMLHMATILLHHPNVPVSPADAVDVEESPPFLKCVSAVENILNLLKTSVNTSPSPTTLENPFLAPSLFIAARILCVRYLDSLRRSTLSSGASSNGIDDRDSTPPPPQPPQSVSTPGSGSLGRSGTIPTDIDLILLVFDRMKEVWPALAGKYKDLILYDLRRDPKTIGASIRSGASGFFSRECATQFVNGGHG